MAGGGISGDVNREEKTGLELERTENALEQIAISRDRPIA